MKNFIANLNSLKKNVFHDQFIHAFNDFREIFNESFVKIAKIQKFLYFFEIKKSHSIHYDLHFFWIHAYVFDADYNAQKKDFFDEKFAFRDVYLKIDIAKTFEYKFHMFDVLFSYFVVNENIIQITLHEIVDKISKYIVHVMLIIDWIICEIEKQNFVFVKIQKNNERNEIFVFRIYAKFVENRNNI